MEPEVESNTVEEFEAREDTMSDGYDDPADADEGDAGYQQDYSYSGEVIDDVIYDVADNSADMQRYEETDDVNDDVNVMDTQTGDIIRMEGEVCNMDMESVDVGCKDTPPIPDKAARDLNDNNDQLRAEDDNKDEYPKRTPEKLKISKDAPWHKVDSKEAPVDEKAPPIPIKTGNTKSRIQMFEAMWRRWTMIKYIN